MRLILVSLLAILTGCASGPLYKEVTQPPENKSVVYIYRPFQGFNAGGWPHVYVNEEKLFALKNKGYGVLYLKPGEHTIKVEGNPLLWYPGPKEITHNFEEKERYYIRVTPSMTSAIVVGGVVGMSGKTNVLLVSKEQASPEIAKTKKIIEKEI